jgi:hypothetical protein
MSEYILTHKHHTHTHAASGWRIHCGAEVTELSTNKQHSLSKKADSDDDEGDDDSSAAEVCLSVAEEPVRHRGAFPAPI